MMIFLHSSPILILWTGYYGSYHYVAKAVIEGRQHCPKMRIYNLNLHFLYVPFLETSMDNLFSPGMLLSQI